LIGTVSSNGTSLTLTPTATFEVIAQESNKTPAQVAVEFNAFNAALQTYQVQKQIDPNLPQHTENTSGDKNSNPGQTKTALGSAPANPVATETIAEQKSPGTTGSAPAATLTPVVVTVTSPVVTPTGPAAPVTE